MNVPSVGSVELGKVPLKVTQNEEEKMDITPGRRAYQFHSGQNYSPIFKRLTNKVAMNKQKHLGSLAALVSTLMLPTIIREMSSKDREKINELIEMLVDVHNNYGEEIRQSGGNNSARSEKYFSSNFNDQNQDWTFPEIPFTDFLLFSRQNSYFTTVFEMLKEAIDVLQKVFLSQRTQTNYDSLSAPAKRMIVVLVEMCIVMCEFSPFNAKSMEKVNKYLKSEKLKHGQVDEHSVDKAENNEESESENEAEDSDEESSNRNSTAETGNTMSQENSAGEDRGSDEEEETFINVNSRVVQDSQETAASTASQSTEATQDSEKSEESNLRPRNLEKTLVPRIQPNFILWNIPGCILCKLPQRDTIALGIVFGLALATMPIPEYATPLRMQEDDIKSRNTEYIQMYLNDSTREIKLMNHYVFLLGRILSIFWHYQGLATGTDPKPSLFELPDFDILAGMSEDLKRMMLHELSKIVSNAYDLEWWFLARQRSMKSFKRGEFQPEHSFKGPDRFPTTKDELAIFASGKPQIERDGRNDKEINTIGK